MVRHARRRQGDHAAGSEKVGAAQGMEDRQFQDEVDAAVDGGRRAGPLVQQRRFAVLDETAAQDGRHGDIAVLGAQHRQLARVAVMDRVVFGREACTMYRHGGFLLYNMMGSAGPGWLPNRSNHIIIKP